MESFALSCVRIANKIEILRRKGNNAWNHSSRENWLKIVRKGVKNFFFHSSPCQAPVEPKNWQNMFYQSFPFNPFQDLSSWTNSWEMFTNQSCAIFFLRPISETFFLRVFNAKKTTKFKAKQSLGLCARTRDDKTFESDYLTCISSTSWAKKNESKETQHLAVTSKRPPVHADTQMTGEIHLNSACLFHFFFLF